MKQVSFIVAMVFAACATHAVAAENLPEMVVTPTGDATPLAQLGQSVTVITAADIANKGWRSLPEALRTVPGVYITQAGAPGSTTTISIRGSRTRHVLVLVNGIRAGDPSTIERAAFVPGIDLANVERIEIVRGAVSGLYGSDAVAGVVNVITKDATEGTTVSLFAEGGSYSTYRVGAELSGRTGIVSYAVNATYLDSEGYSSAAEWYEGNTENDAFNTLNVSARLGLQPTETTAFDVFAQYNESEDEYDAGAADNGDSDVNVATTDSLLAGLEARFGADDAKWKQKVAAQYSVFDREFVSTWGENTFEGKNWEVEWRNDVALCESHTLTAGLGYRDETSETDGRDKASAFTQGVFIQDKAIYGAFSGVANVRYDDHQEFGEAITYLVAPSYVVEKTGTRLKGSYGTGYKAPALYQLYAPAAEWGPVGNADLDPEESTTWDVGFEQVVIEDLLSAGLTYFSSEVEDQIEFLTGYENVSEVDSSGVEAFVSVTPCDCLSIDATYTYTDAEDKETGKQLVRVPEDRATLGINYAIADRGNVSATATYVSDRSDLFYDAAMFSNVEVEIDDYIVVDLSASCDVTEKVTVFGRVENVFDEEYEEVYGYGTAGLSGYGGVRVEL